MFGDPQLCRHEKNIWYNFYAFGDERDDEKQRFGREVKAYYRRLSDTLDLQLPHDWLLNPLEGAYTLKLLYKLIVANTV